MSRLNRYINEVKDQNWFLDKFISLIQKDCKPFLNDIKGARGMFARTQGFKMQHGKEVSRDPIFKRPVRKERRPLDSSPELHEWFDDYFLKKFGWRARSNVLFTWGRPFNIISLHDWLVFPVGKYKIVWSTDVIDLYNWEGAPDPDSSIPLGPLGTEYYEQVGKTYTDKNLKKAVISENEVMVNAKEVYMVRGYLVWDINERLNLNWQGLKRR